MPHEACCRVISQALGKKSLTNDLREIFPAAADRVDEGGKKPRDRLRPRMEVRPLRP